MKREAYVAGAFYPGEATALRGMVSGLTDPAAEKKKALCVVSPHAGYIYSGGVAGAVFSSVEIPNRVILLGPSHSPIRSHFAIAAEGVWTTPLGSSSIAASLADNIRGESALITEDNQAHRSEHSLEVQLPFLQYLNPETAIVPISVTYFATFADLEELGRAVARATVNETDPVLIVASTDMSHQVSQETAEKKDFMAIDKILTLDPRGLYEVVRSQDISMCGFQATTAALIAAKEMGAEKAELIRYQTSGDTTGDYRSVVGYAGLRIL